METERKHPLCYDCRREWVCDWVNADKKECKDFSPDPQVTLKQERKPDEDSNLHR